MRLLVFLIGLFITINLQAQESRDITYIRKHALLAVEEMHLYKIPASITLAQGLLETGGGQSRLAEHANNHFGIKCKSEKEWPLHKGRIYHDDDAKGECFRSYNSVNESYRDHSEFLALRPYYKALFTLHTTDYKAWAHGLKKAGYATDPTYASKLISRIEKYKLNQFDHISTDEVYTKLYSLYENEQDKYIAQNQNKQQKYIASNSKSNKKENLNNTTKSKKEIIEDESLSISQTIEKELETTNNRHRITIEPRKENPQLRIKRHPNNIAYVVAEVGETLGSIGKTYKKAPSELAEYNEIRLGSKLKEGQIVFFDKKKTKGSQSTYKANSNDDLYTISQKFGIKISNLYKYNNMEPGDQPREGQIIYLKKKG